MISDLITESAKATQGFAKTASKAHDQADKLGGWLDRIFGEAIGETVVAIWTIKVRERHIAACI